MSAFIALTVVLVAMNLTRLVGRGWLLGLLTALALVAGWLLGWILADGWWRPGVLAVVAGLAVTLWHHWRLAHAWPGLLVLTGAVATPLVLLPSGPAAPEVLPLLVAALLLADPATRTLRWGMGLVGKTVTGLPDSLGRGEAIGVLERWITLLMVVRGDYAALGFLMAAKTLARHKRFDEPGFAEYFLVGTLGSVLMAMVLGEVVRAF